MMAHCQVLLCYSGKIKFFIRTFCRMMLKRVVSPNKQKQFPFSETEDEEILRPLSTEEASS